MDAAGLVQGRHLGQQLSERRDRLTDRQRGLLGQRIFPGGQGTQALDGPADGQPRHGPNE
jgi:hypothetical protein